MNEIERVQFLATCRYAIAICKQEVEKTAPGIIDALITVDDGSPWGRAFIRCCQESHDEVTPS